MAELKSMILWTIALLFVASSMITIYSYALTNNIANGGSGTNVPFDLVNQTEAYTAQMTAYSKQLSNTTLTASEQPSAGNAFTGIGALATIGTAAISLSFSSMGILMGMIASSGLTLTALGFPPTIFGFGTLYVIVAFGLTILAAVFKWWL